MKRSYLARVYAYDKRLFFFIAGFAGLTLLCNLAGHEVTPFFVWGMYSAPEKSTDQYEVLETRLADGKTLDASAGYADNTRFFLNSPLAQYKEMKENGGIDVTRSIIDARRHNKYRWITPLEDRIFNGEREFQAFTDWYARYLPVVTGEEVRAFAVEVKHVHYDDHQHIVVDSTHLLTEWRQH